MATMSTHHDPGPPACSDAPAASFRDLRMEFRRHRREPLTALDSLTLDVAHGQVFGLLGPNGSGKTTSVNLLCGLLRPTRGTVLCEGIDVRTDVTAVRTHLGVVPQETALYNDLSADENLSFHARLYGVPRDERRGRIDEALELVGLAERRRDRVGGLEPGRLGRGDGRVRGDGLTSVIGEGVDPRLRQRTGGVADVRAIPGGIGAGGDDCESQTRGCGDGEAAAGNGTGGGQRGQRGSGLAVTGLVA